MTKTDLDFKIILQSNDEEVELINKVGNYLLELYFDEYTDDEHNNNKNYENANGNGDAFEMEMNDNVDKDEFNFEQFYPKKISNNKKKEIILKLLANQMN